MPLSFFQGIPSVSQELTIQCKNFGDAFTFTFLDVDNSVQYAAARPPIHTCPATGCPVLFTFHGAGVGKTRYNSSTHPCADAANPGWTNSYKRQNYTWTLFPTNRRAYGWDWQDPGRYDAFAALGYLATYLPGVSSDLAPKFAVDPYKVLYAGHSMGGHGCWNIASHFPDR
jgi:pimeloyl-ACP methyl ester carboxylesterase